MLRVRSSPARALIVGRFLKNFYALDGSTWNKRHGWRHNKWVLMWLRLGRNTHYITARNVRGRVKKKTRSLKVPLTPPTRASLVYSSPSDFSDALVTTLIRFAERDAADKREILREWESSVECILRSGTEWMFIARSLRVFWCCVSVGSRSLREWHKTRVHWGSFCKK